METSTAPMFNRPRGFTNSLLNFRYLVVINLLLFLIIGIAFYLVYRHFAAEAALIIGMFIFGFLVFIYQKRILWALKEQVSQQERYLLNILQSSRDAIIFVDTDNCIHGWNRAAELIFGYSAEEMIGQTFHRLIPPELDANEELKRIQDEVIAKGYLRNYITPRVTKSGCSITIDLSSTLVRSEGGQIIGSIVIIKDVTEKMGLMRKQILVVDDELEILKMLERTIKEKTPYQIVTTNNSLEVPGLLEKNQFDLIITDLKMPGLDGLDILRMVKEKRRDEEVIIVTAFGSLETTIEALSLGAFDYITKPFRREQIIFTLDRAMRWQRMKGEIARVSDIFKMEPYETARRALEQEYIRRLAKRAFRDEKIMVERSGLPASVIASVMKEEETKSG